MVKIISIVAALVFIQLSSSSALANQPTALLTDLEQLSSNNMAGRKPGTTGHLLARAYLVKRYASLGLKPFNNDFQHSFNFPKNSDKNTGYNLVGWIKGSEFPDQYLVYTAHYDHLGVKGKRIYNGADDNASGVSAMLAVAQQFTTKPPRYSIIFVATDAEEFGLHGAKAFLRKPPVNKENMLLNINLDMIANGGKRNILYIAGLRKSNELKQLIKPLLAKYRTSSFRLKSGHDKKSVYKSGERDWRQASDHGAFIRAKIPYLYFGVDEHKLYHTSRDTFENLDKEFYQQAVTAILDVSMAINLHNFSE